MAKEAAELVTITEEEVAAHEQIIPGVSASTLLDAMDDPSYFEGIARADLLIQMAHMRRLANNPEFSTGQRIEYSKFLAQMGKVAHPDKNLTPLDTLPMISIVLPNSGGQINIGAQPRPLERDITPVVVSDQRVDGSLKPSKAVLP